MGTNSDAISNNQKIAKNGKKMAYFEQKNRTVNQPKILDVRFLKEEMLFLTSQLTKKRKKIF